MRFVKNVKLFLLEAIAEERIFYAAAESQERRIPRRFTVIAEEEPIPVIHIDALIAELALNDARAINTVPYVVAEF